MTNTIFINKYIQAVSLSLVYYKEMKREEEIRDFVVQRVFKIKIMCFRIPTHLCETSFA